MAKLYRNEWENAIHDAAVSAAAEWRKYVGERATDEGEKRAYEKIFYHIFHTLIFRLRIL